MPGVVLNPDESHICFAMVPAEAGWFARAGTRWQCSDCKTIWVLVRGQGWIVSE